MSFMMPGSAELIPGQELGGLIAHPMQSQLAERRIPDSILSGQNRPPSTASNALWACDGSRISSRFYLVLIIGFLIVLVR
jgi:hypothetical protein